MGIFDTFWNGTTHVSVERSLSTPLRSGDHSCPGVSWSRDP